MNERGEKRPDQTVPLVIYKGGERIEIGQVLLKGDGSFAGQIAKDVRKELSDQLFNNVGDFSLNPKLPANPDMKYHIVSQTEARADLGLPPKIQE